MGKTINKLCNEIDELKIQLQKIELDKEKITPEYNNILFLINNKKEELSKIKRRQVQMVDNKFNKVIFRYIGVALLILIFTISLLVFGTIRNMSFGLLSSFWGGILTIISEIGIALVGSTFMIKYVDKKILNSSEYMEMKEEIDLISNEVNELVKIETDLKNKIEMLDLQCSSIMKEISKKEMVKECLEEEFFYQDEFSEEYKEVNDIVRKRIIRRNISKGKL